LREWRTFARPWAGTRETPDPRVGLQPMFPLASARTTYQRSPECSSPRCENTREAAGDQRWRLRVGTMLAPALSWLTRPTSRKDQGHALFDAILLRIVSRARSPSLPRRRKAVRAARERSPRDAKSFYTILSSIGQLAFRPKARDLARRGPAKAAFGPVTGRIDESPGASNATGPCPTGNMRGAAFGGAARTSTAQAVAATAICFLAICASIRARSATTLHHADFARKASRPPRCSTRAQSAAEMRKRTERASASDVSVTLTRLGRKRVRVLRLEWLTRLPDCTPCRSIRNDGTWIFFR